MLDLGVWCHLTRSFSNEMMTSHPSWLHVAVVMSLILAAYYLSDAQGSLTIGILNVHMGPVIGCTRRTIREIKQKI